MSKVKKSTLRFFAVLQTLISGFERFKGSLDVVSGPVLHLASEVVMGMTVLIAIGKG